jgi:hypothetical protein
LQQARKGLSEDFGHPKGGFLRGAKSGDKVDVLRKRANEIKAALEAVQAKQRQQEKTDDRRIKMLIGTAMVADVDAAEKEQRSQRKVLIAEVLARNTVSEGARAFLKVKGWL